MPSFRATLQIHGLRPGHEPEEVMDTAIRTLAERHLVEANQLDVVAGVPRITLRFLVDTSTDPEEDAAAWQAAARMRAGVEQVAVTASPQVLRRRRGKWLPARRPSS
ncbi:hypothetical protein KIH31_12940 [Paenarthrobacter sp. DKR-5]|uniref:hypothetical protein n=1 Tax=Paenarthrobacter sp. DKR-5 TaxID=2835535 RepID=UPI001BDD40D4|nr:hypothetical protein [Paenarthrobacter sp. DKR-5]MBT1003510.1 hypothetical protein [Paenarthrobacter sp. DKR-5]